MRVEARDSGKEWKPGAVTCVKPLRVKLDVELSACGWDEVRPLSAEEESAAKKKPLAGIMAKIQEDAENLLKAAKEEALNELKAAVGGVKLLNSLESPSPEAFKEAKLRVAKAIKSAQEKGVSTEELVAASSAMGAAQKEEQAKAEKGTEKKERIKKERKQQLVVVYDNPAVGEAGQAAALEAKGEGKTIPEIVVAAFTAASKVEGASAEDLKKVKKVAAAQALDGSSSSSDSSSSSGGEAVEEEKEIDDSVKKAALREGIAAVFYFDALKNAPSENERAAAAASAAPAAPSPP